MCDELCPLRSTQPSLHLQEKKVALLVLQDLQADSEFNFLLLLLAFKKKKQFYRLTFFMVI